MLFQNREHAGQELGRRLAYLRGQQVVVVGLPRGGVVVAYEVARALGAPLDVIVVRKLGVPVQPELAMGAIAEGGVLVVNDETRLLTSITPADLHAVEARERVELDRRIRRFRGSQPRAPLAGRTVVVVDDGIATGATAAAACQAVRAAGATRVVLAAPVGPPERIAWLHQFAEEVVCLATPDEFFAIGAFYVDFTQTADEEVTDLLHRAALIAAPAAGHTVHANGTAGTARTGGASPAHAVEVRIPTDTTKLSGDLTVPDHPHGLVVFAHGSGSSRQSPRNRYVSDVLVDAGLATLLFDLLTPEEELDRENVFDIDTLARRLIRVTRWLREEPDIAYLPVGYFGASTGAAAALWAAAEFGPPVTAVVSRGGRPDLAASRLARVSAPTLLIVGERDELVLDLNREAQSQLRCESRLAVVPAATHLFTQPGALEAVAVLARDWFVHHLALVGHSS
ncbi:phosphoribosyl transferase [Frankia sp. CcI49]|uniref:phosphoribosyltransferase family protein n=1 Tax=unclassified Frankia TaxID=2632575 RepID=UPI0006C9FABE|nr:MULTISPECIES: phosphoribosyltransferase family protein [unclassified Frankia]KPM55358.1 phosphoribosyl transferase [Frankia sp. R43]ONH53450.1 phosphoribosyl transferase [Frankia sp. CcI49]